MTPSFLVVGAHILDVLVRPVDAVPPGQSSVLVQEAAMTPAGTAAGTAVGLARLGEKVATAGVVGTDLIGTVLLEQMTAEGVDVSYVRRDPGAPTSISVLPIRSNGERPALHLTGANALLGPADIPWDLVESSDFVHIGGCDRLPASAGDLVPDILRRARDRGAITSMDVLAPGSAHVFRQVSAALPYVDYFLPNTEQALALTGTADLAEAARVLLEAGAGQAVITCGADGCALFGRDRTVRHAAIPVHAVDTTGCGDAFTAGFLSALARGDTPDAALAIAVAAGAVVATGLGSNANLRNMAELERLATYEGGSQ
jgi:sugar/nucleoside kinase (ribokinase family)